MELLVNQFLYGGRKRADRRARYSKAKLIKNLIVYLHI
nr:MAG TPA: hypothetical protein [Crassvirales sp.]